MKRQLSTGDDLCESGFLPVTQTVRAIFADGSSQRFVFDTDVPVVGVEKDKPLPWFPRNAQTGGPAAYYESNTRMAVNKEKLLEAMDPAGKRVVPLQMRKREKRMEQWKPYTPQVGDVIGFVAGFEMTYSGHASPVARRPGELIHVFSIRGERYVASSRAAEILTTCGPGGGNMTQKSLANLKVGMNKLKRAVTIQSRPADVFDTLMMLKLLGAVSPFSPKQTFVPTKAVDDILLESGLGDVMRWAIVQNKNSPPG